MKRTQPHELQQDAVPGLVLNLSVARLRELFPVEFDAMDPLSEPEPSEGALVRLDSGLQVVVVHGTITHRVTLSFPATADLSRALPNVFAEIPVRSSEIVWTAESAARTAAR
jgi:hypothetical protein